MIRPYVDPVAPLAAPGIPRPWAVNAETGECAAPAGRSTRGNRGVPSFNKGLKSSVQQTSTENAEPDTALCIDFLAFSAPLSDTLLHLDAEYPYTSSALEDIDHNREFVAAALLRWLKSWAPNIVADGDLRGFRHFYDHHVRLSTIEGAQCGFIAFGGERQRGTWALQLTGAGCAHVMAWDRARQSLENIRAKITRLDIAHDDFKGRHDYALARRLADEGAFTTNGRPPVCEWIESTDEGAGRTLYVGKNAGNQQLCVYEKGKQLGDSLSPWVRWEVRFGSKYRDIPLDALCEPASYVAGHVPVMRDWIDATAKRMRTHVERAAASLSKALHYCRHQYGRLLHTLRNHIPDERAFVGVIETLGKSGVPKWAADIPHSFIAVGEGITRLHRAELHA